MRSNNKTKETKSSEITIQNKPIEIRGIVPQGITNNSRAMSIAMHNLRFFNLPDTGRLIAVNKNSNALLQQPLSDIKAALLNELQQHVAYGRQEQAKNIIQEHPWLLLARGDFADNAKITRTFKNISVLRYAFWALDPQMAEMMLNLLPEDGKIEASAQLAENVRYQLNDGSPICELHFNSNPLKKAYDNFVWYGTRKNWLIIGQRQAELPAAAGGSFSFFQARDDLWGRGRIGGYSMSADSVAFTALFKISKTKLMDLKKLLPTPEAKPEIVPEPHRQSCVIS